MAKKFAHAYARNFSPVYLPHLNNPTSASGVAHHLFSDLNLIIVSDGACVLGSPVRSPEFINQWIKENIQTWTDEINLLAIISHSQPQSAFSSLTHGLLNRWKPDKMLLMILCVTCLLYPAALVALVFLIPLLSLLFNTLVLYLCRPL